MSSRNAIVAGLLLLTLFFGAVFLADEDQPNVKAVLLWSQMRQALDHYGAGTKVAEIPDRIVNQAYYFARTLSADRELLFYGGIALFGILMMGLAVGSASSTTKEKADSMVELLKREKEKAEHLAKLKAEFLNQVSHELRTPLAVIIGYIECITDGLYGQIEAKHQEILQVVAKQSTHLKNMIDQILIYSRLEASKQPLRIEEFLVSKIVNDLRDTFDFLCRQKGLELHWELSREVTSLKSDAERLKEVLSNLLQNAVKYTDHGSIWVRLNHLTASDSIMIEVADTGVGIPEHCLSSIFEPFMQAHKTSSENLKGGIGLGLSIVKKHLEQIKGTITVESDVGKGSTFRIILPRVYKNKPGRRIRLLGLIKLPFTNSQKMPDSLKAQYTASAQKITKTSQALG